MVETVCTNRTQHSEKSEKHKRGDSENIVVIVM